MKPFKRIYYISHLFIEGTDTKEIATFQVNGLEYKLCLKGYSRAEQQDIEDNINTLYWDDDEFEKFFIPFLEEYRGYLQKLCSLDNVDPRNFIYVREVVEASTLSRDVEITEYRKRIRTADKMCPMKK